MELTIYLKDGNMIPVQEFVEVTYFTLTGEKSIKGTLKGLSLVDGNTYVFKGKTEVAINGSEISNVHLNQD